MSKALELAKALVAELEEKEKSKDLWTNGVFCGILY